MADEITPRFTLEDPPTRTRAKASSSGPKHDAGSTTPPKAQRPRGSAAAERALAADVTAAMATLDSLYTMIGAGLELFGAPLAAAEWQLRSNGLRGTNETALAASPRLARTLAGAGATSGGAQLVISHTVAIAPVLLIARAEFAERAAQREAGRHAAEQEEPLTFAERVAQEQAAAAQPTNPVRNIRPEDDPTFIRGFRA